MTQQQISSTCSEDESFGDDTVADVVDRDRQIITMMMPALIKKTRSQEHLLIYIAHSYISMHNLYKKTKELCLLLLPVDTHRRSDVW